MSTIRDIRNLLVHSPLVNGKYPVEPSDEINGAVLEEILEKVEQPKKAMNYATWAVKFKKPFRRRSLSGDAYDGIKEGFHTFDLSTARKCSAFSVKAPFSVSIFETICLRFKEECELKEFGNLLDIENHSDEYFEFAPKDALYTDILELFNTSYIKNGEKRLAIVFPDRNGQLSRETAGFDHPLGCTR